MIKLLWIDDNLDHDLTEKRMALYMEDDGSFRLERMVGR